MMTLVPKKSRSAPRGPGSKPRWTSSAKTAVGTAISKQGRLWYTIGQGVLNELYFPDIDKSNTRTIRFLVTDGTEFFSDEEHDATHQVCPFEIWTEHAPRQWISKGKQLRMDFDAPGTIVWKADRGAENTLQTEAPHFGLHSTLLDLPDA